MPSSQVSTESPFRIGDEGFTAVAVAIVIVALVFIADSQRKGLEKRFQQQKYISKPDRKKLAERLGLKDSQVSCFHLLNCFLIFP